MDKELKTAIRDLLLALRNMPQCYTFSDVSSKIDPDFRGEIDRILLQITD